MNLIKKNNSSILIHSNLSKLITDSILEFEEHLKQLSNENLDTLKKIDYKKDSSKYYNRLNTKVKSSI